MKKIKLEKIMNNFNKVTIGDVELYFSYETLIAFTSNGMLTIIENYWNVTTGKHLNYINENKAIRVDRDTFEERKNVLLGAYNLSIAC